MPKSLDELAHRLSIPSCTYCSHWRVCSIRENMFRAFKDNRLKVNTETWEIFPQAIAAHCSHYDLESIYPSGKGHRNLVSKLDNKDLTTEVP